MKAIIRRDRTTGAIVDDLGEYESLTAQGKTDEKIAGLVGEYNERNKDKDRIADHEVKRMFKDQPELFPAITELALKIEEEENND